DAAGALSSTVDDVVDALNATPALDGVMTAAVYRNDAGGIAEVDSEQFSDFLSAPDSIPREPFTMKMLRIGKHRDGSKVGVFGYAQEHAREWQTSLMALETA